MPEAKQITRPTPYASSDDFRRVFDEDMNSLYLLSFLLTADREKAEQCFVSGLEDAVEGNPVFKEWARSWARRVIIDKRREGNQPAANGRKWRFELCLGQQQWQNAAGGAGRDCRSSCTRAV